MDPLFALTNDEALALQKQSWWHRTRDAVFELTGPGTVACVQGLFTNDIVRPGATSLLWGAFLTPKGAIIADLWVQRDGDQVRLLVPAVARDTVATLLARTFPPRLTKVRGAWETTTIYSCHHPVGPTALGGGFLHPTGPAPFTSLLLAPHGIDAATDPPPPLDGRREAPTSWLAAHRVLQGWPTLGREIDERTLVQEVRFDELEGVRYDKGCYTGQETVARLHFRGHANRLLRRVTLDGPPVDTEIRQGEKVVGRLSTWGTLGTQTIGLAIIRREVEPGQTIEVGGVGGTLSDEGPRGSANHSPSSH